MQMFELRCFKQILYYESSQQIAIESRRYFADFQLDFADWVNERLNFWAKKFYLNMFSYNSAGRLESIPDMAPISTRTLVYFNVGERSKGSFRIFNFFFHPHFQFIRPPSPFHEFFLTCPINL